MTSKRISEADQTALLLSQQREMVELRRRNEELSRKNEQEIEVFCRENKDMKNKLMEGGLSIMPTNLVGKSVTSPPNPKPMEETKDRAPTQEMDGESCPNKLVCTTGRVDSMR